MEYIDPIVTRLKFNQFSDSQGINGKHTLEFKFCNSADFVACLAHFSCVRSTARQHD